MKKENQTHYLPLFMSVGVSVGLAIGAATNNIPIGMCIGIGVGMCLGSSLDMLNRKNAEKAKQENEKEENDPTAE